MFEHFRRATARPGAGTSPGQYRNGKAEQHPGHCGMDAGGVDQYPGNRTQRQQDEPGRGCTGPEKVLESLCEEGVDPERDHSQQQRAG